MRQLRLYGIYKLPGVLRPIYPFPVGGIFYLYDFKLGSSVPPRFIIDDDGRVVNWHGERMSLTVDDLIDTGDSFYQKE